MSKRSHEFRRLGHKLPILGGSGLPVRMTTGSPEPLIPCRHQANAPLHVSPAVALIHVPEGCHCFPDDRYQFLCLQHLYKLDHAPYQIVADMRHPAERNDPCALR